MPFVQQFEHMADLMIGLLYYVQDFPKITIAEASTMGIAGPFAAPSPHSVIGCNRLQSAISRNQHKNAAYCRQYLQ